YLLWIRPGWRPAAAAALAMVVPLLGYAALHDARTGTFGLTEWEGWFLYGRVAQLADCRHVDVPRRVRNLCPTAADKRLEGSDPNVFYLWDSRSPARRLYGDPRSQAQNRLANDRLREFGVAVLRAKPLDYLHAVASDYL